MPRFEWAAALCLLLTSCSLDSTPLPSNTDPIDNSGDVTSVDIPSSAITPTDLELVSARVVDVTDGDSLVVEINGIEQRVRLLGINAPERDECLGDESRLSLRESAGTEVGLALESDSRDQFGRTLAHVFSSDRYLNLEQVAAGLAFTITGDHSFALDLSMAQRSAQDSGVGLWSTTACGRGPIPDVAITRIDGNPPGPDDEALELEVVEITNLTDLAADLGGFVLRDESTANRFTFPDATILGPGESIEISSGCRATDRVLAWCAGGPVWNNGGDTALLLDRSGRIVDYRPYLG